MAHVDRSEVCATSPLVSISLVSNAYLGRFINVDLVTIPTDLATPLFSLSAVSPEM
jgi:hypothetical protein